MSETTAAPTVTLTPSQYLLVRGWEGYELLNSVYYCGQYRPLPTKLDGESGMTLVNGVLTFPDGSSAKASCTEDGTVTTLRLNRDTAPADFSVYGVGFDAKPDDIPDTVGIANNVTGDVSDRIVFSFYDGGITELTFVFEKKTLTEIYIAA